MTSVIVAVRMGGLLARLRLDDPTRNEPIARGIFGALHGADPALEDPF
jgi:hypothetical protein